MLVTTQIRVILLIDHALREFALTNPQSFLRCYFAWKQEVWLQMCAVLSGYLCPRLGILIPTPQSTTE